MRWSARRCASRRSRAAEVQVHFATDEATLIPDEPA